MHGEGLPGRPRRGGCRMNQTRGQCAVFVCLSPPPPPTLSVAHVSVVLAPVPLSVPLSVPQGLLNGVAAFRHGFPSLKSKNATVFPVLFQYDIG